MGRGPTKNYHKNMNEFYVAGSLTCLKPRVIEKKITTDFPLVLNIEPTNDCNLRCCFCPRDKVAERYGIHYIDWSLYKSLIDQADVQAQRYGKLIMLNLHKDGEPLLHPKLPDMVRYAKEREIFHTIHLNTNGMLLGSEQGKELLKSGIDDITISVDAARAETFARFKGVDALAKLEKNIQQFYRWRDELGAKTFIRVKIMEFDDIEKEEVEEFISKWEPIADEVQVTGVHSWSGAIDKLNITDEQSSERYPCALLWYMLAVNADGKVSVCNVDWDRSGVIGDAHMMALKDIWNNSQMKQIRHNQLKQCWHKPAVCESCVIWVSIGDMKEYFLKRKDFWK